MFLFEGCHPIGNLCFYVSMTLGISIVETVAKVNGLKLF